MDAELLKTCHREIGHIVFDANEKITTRRISNTWSLDSKQALEILQKWVEEQKEQKKLSLEYVLRGIDKNGSVFIAFANEQKTEKVCKMYPKCSKMLYSVEIASDVRPLNVSNDNEFSALNIRLNTEKRQVEPSSTQPPAPVKQEPKPSKPNMFSMASKPPVKEEKSTPPPTQAVVKPEPKTASPTKASPKTQSPKKDTKKAVTTGKGAISSFFSSKPSQSSAAKALIKQEPQSPAPKAPVKQEKQSPAPTAPEKKEKETKPEPPKSVETTRKRTITDDEATEEEGVEEEDVIPNTPQEDKKRNDGKKRTSKPLLQRKKPSNPSKKSRILQICDSSSEEEMDGKEAAEQRAERLVEFDEEMAEPTAEQENARKSLSPEKPVENDSNSVNRNHRSKVKKLITKTYTDEKGYLITVKDYEMVSEDESAGNGTEADMVTPPVTKPKATVGSSQGKGSTAAKKQTPPTPKTKQGSIMSFFAKK